MLFKQKKKKKHVGGRRIEMPPVEGEGAGWHERWPLTGKVTYEKRLEGSKSGNVCNDWG